ncbi:MAG: AmmeMemoRadiSam system protein A [Oscillospiraceae bacterium]|nr:AmmeMemoRadiSam system protein A [Oscillospiraceae bacterium]
MSENNYVRLARETIEAFVNEGRIIEKPGWLQGEMQTQKAGVFVSLKKHRDLRGCIGTISPTCDSIAEEIIQNAISACSRDPRFPPVTPTELGNLSISVDVLSDSEPVMSLEELDVKRFGVIVSKGFRRGLLLPNLEGVNTVEEQISIAMQKAGILDGEGCKLEKFEVVRHE